MKVFISWSGDTSRAIARQIQDWLGIIVQKADFWISQRDISPGERWALVLSKALEDCNIAIICVTQDNKNSQWIHFEAGAIARPVNGKVVPLLFDINSSDLDGPLSQFQSVPLNQNGMSELVRILHEDTGTELEIKQHEKLFSQMWPMLQEQINMIKLSQQHGKTIEDPADVVDEIIGSTEQLTLDHDNSRIISNFDKENKRLHNELERLKQEDEKLTLQDAPISMDRALAHTQERLNVLQTTIEKVLDQIFYKLTPSQVDLLFSFLLKNRRILRFRYEFPPTANDDLDILVKYSLIEFSGNHLQIGHDLVAAYLEKKRSV